MQFIYSVHSTDDYDVKSPGAILGIILAAIIIIAATIIVFVICMKKRWNKSKERLRRKPKTHTEKKKEIVSQKPPTITGNAFKKVLLKEISFSTFMNLID